MNARVVWIDVLKAFAIFTVVAGHMMSCDAFYSTVGVNVYQEFIQSFHMPLFTILSGWFFHARRSALDFLCIKSISILLPYIVWCFVWYFLKPIIQIIMAGGEIHLSSVVWQIKFFLHDGLLCYGWWFLRGLFFSLLLSYGSVRFAEHCGKTIAKHAYAYGGWVSCIGLYALCFTGIIPNQPEKDSLLKGFIFMYPFFWSGFFLRWTYERKLEYFDSGKCFCFVSLLFVVLLLFWDGSNDTFYAMNTSVVEMTGANDIVGMKVVYRTFFRFIVGLVGSVSFILLFRKLRSFGSEHKICNYCQNVGTETLGIYILQSLVYWSLPNYDILGFGDWGNFLFALVLSGMIILVAYTIIKLTSRNKWLGLVLWGKKV